MPSSPTASRPFMQVDVFAERALAGNPLAVVLDGSGLSDAQMQDFARWTHLSETTFVLPPTPEAAAQGADYRVRIFTTDYEMPFAGHPTLGTAHAWLAHGGQPRQTDTVVQECPAGLVRIRRAPPEGAGPDRLAFAAPPLTRTTPTPDVLARVLAALGLPQQHVLAAQLQRNGPHQLGLLVDDVSTLLALEPDAQALAAAQRDGGFMGVGLGARHATNGAAPSLIARANREARAFASVAERMPAADLEVRFFFLHGGVVGEDPITGSFNAGLAQWLIQDGHMPARYVAAQGQCVGADGRVFLERDAQGQVWVGGRVMDSVRGEVRL